MRTYVWKLLEHCLEKSLIPELWKKGLTVLAYKKGLADDPANFQPITLEPVIAKVLTSLIRNRIYAFLSKSSYYTFTMVFIFQLQGMVFLQILSQYKEEFYKETAFHR